MTAEEIRAEAIERLRTALKPVAEDSCCTVCRDPYAPYIDGEVNIGALVDALGDLLPTRTEWAVSWTDTRYDVRELQDASIECRDDAERFRHEYSDNDDYPELTDVRVERRYRTDWKAATK